MTPETIESVLGQKPEKPKVVKRPKKKILTQQVRFFLTPKDWERLQVAVAIDQRFTPAKFIRFYIMQIVESMIIRDNARKLSDEFTPEMMEEFKKVMSEVKKEKDGGMKHPDLF